MIFYFKKYILILLLINILLPGYLFNPENIALSGSGSIVYNDMRSINPATLANHKGLSIQLFGANFGLGNTALSISDYNDINGSNFDNPTASKYFAKSDVLSLFDDGLGFDSQIAFSIPFTDIIYNNISFSSRSYCSLDANLPQSLIALTLYGNKMNSSYNLNIDNSINFFSEHAIGYSKSINSISIGFRIKYLQGLASGNLSSLSDNSSYFFTDSIGFLGKAEYVMNQSVGGSGIGLDIGFLTNKSIKGWNFGLSASNLFSRIEWDENNITYNYFKNSIISKLPLRYGEKQYFSINLDTLNAMNMMNMPINEIYKIENFSIIELTNVDNMDFITVDFNEYGDSILVSNYGELIITDYGSYLLETTNISDALLDSLSSRVESYKTQYPVFFNLGASKEIDENIFLCLDLSTGFNNSFKNSKKWKLSTGILFNRFENIPITLGLGFGGANKINSGFSIGYNKGPLLFNFGFGTRNGIFIPSIKGVDFSFSLIFKTNSIKKHIFYKNKS
tara:strand:+ start:741 stop:2261 length:1521 start_codon:yes stop_codon:yes gene_type:complete